ncbi:MAG: mannose-1-phosphate guanylyltransferase [Bacteroidetes bacterium]|nr:MAG: mannose-1-phosphate guanylyltransferase [Bacteroidota bacterium]
MENQYVVIMAGGIGSRFWPHSRKDKPKQFLDILGLDKTLLQLTAERFRNIICPDQNIYVVTNADYYKLVKTQLPFLSDDQILLEPIGRNTAPCVAYAAYKIRQKNPEASMVIAPADHLILKQENFETSIKSALDAVKEEDVLVTLGIEPTRPDTGYGYIQAGKTKAKSKLQKVKTFTEKPNLEMALEFLESGDFVWNAGIFVWSVKSIINALEKFMPKLADDFEEIKQNFYTTNEKEAIAHVYSQCHNISIDYGIMEKAKNVYVVKCDLGWSDLGTWKSLYEQSKKKWNENVIIGNVMTYETTNSLIRIPNNKLYVIQGLMDYVVVEHENVVLICQKNQEQRIKQFMEEARKKQPERFF